MLIALLADAYENIFSKKLKAFERATNDRTPLKTFEAGETVMFYSNRGYGRKHKLATLWTGPMEILEKNGPDSYMLKDLSNGQIVNRVHAKYIRKLLV